MNKKIWRVLFSILIDDASKKKGDTLDVEVVPTPVCIEKLKQYNLRFKKIRNGAVVIFENDGVKKPINHIKAESFLFYLKSLNSVLESKLPVSRYIFDNNMPLKINGNGVFYFDNLDKNGKILRGADFSLTVENTLTVADTALLLGSNSTIIFNEDTEIKLDKRSIETESERNLLIFDGKKDVSIPLNFNKLIKDAQTQVFIDLKDALYTLSWGTGASERVLLFKSDNIMFEKPLGLIEIFENNELNLDKTTHYTLHFERRSYWRYVISQDKTMPFSNVKLTVILDSDLRSDTNAVTTLEFLEFDNNSLENPDNKLELDIIKRVEKNYGVKAILYKSKVPMVFDGKPNIQSIVTWEKEEGESISKFEQKLPIPTPNSSEVIINYKIKYPEN